ncbi:hypothetical protein V2A60_000639 [Cordyceps javanica]
MQLLSVLLLTSLSSMGAAAPASFADKLCSATNNKPDCIDPNQIWGVFSDEPKVEEVDNGDRPINFEPVKPIHPIRPTPANQPPTDPKAVCDEKSNAFYDNCVDVEKKPQNECISASDKVLDDCLAA